jgi:hypothetical protein
MYCSEMCTQRGDALDKSRPVWREREGSLERQLLSSFSVPATREHVTKTLMLVILLLFVLVVSIWILIHDE